MHSMVCPGVLYAVTEYLFDLEGNTNTPSGRPARRQIKQNKKKMKTEETEKIYTHENCPYLGMKITLPNRI